MPILVPPSLRFTGVNSVEKEKKRNASCVIPSNRRCFFTCMLSLRFANRVILYIFTIHFTKIVVNVYIQHFIIFVLFIYALMKDCAKMCLSSKNVSKRAPKMLAPFST